MKKAPLEWVTDEGVRCKIPDMRLSVLYSLLSLFLLSACLTQKPAPVALYGEIRGAGSAGVHTVTSGENLWSISRRYNIVMRDIVISNELNAPFVLNPGQRLRLPPPREYRVRAGDSLYSVSRIFNISRTELARLNHVPPPYVIQPGQKLRLPSISSVQKGTVQTASVSSVTGKAIKPSPKPHVKKPSAATRAKINAKTPKRSSSKFLKPARGKIISSYGPKKNGLHNDGINIRAPRGSPVKAADNGVVVYAGSALKGSGNLVLVRHSDRWMTAYAHMDKMKVKRGEILKRGQVLGTVGSTGSVDSPQLHFEVRRGTKAINPARYLDG